MCELRTWWIPSVTHYALGLVNCLYLLDGESQMLSKHIHSSSASLFFTEDSQLGTSKASEERDLSQVDGRHDGKVGRLAGAAR